MDSSFFQEIRFLISDLFLTFESNGKSGLLFDSYVEIDFLLYIQDGSAILAKEKRDIEDPILFIEDLKMEMQKRVKRYLE